MLSFEMLGSLRIRFCDMLRKHKQVMLYILSMFLFSLSVFLLKILPLFAVQCWITLPACRLIYML